MKVTVLPKEMDNIIKRNRCAVKLKKADMSSWVEPDPGWPVALILL